MHNKVIRGFIFTTTLKSLEIQVHRRRETVMLLNLVQTIWPYPIIQLPWVTVDIIFVQWEVGYCVRWIGDSQLFAI